MTEKQLDHKQHAALETLLKAYIEERNCTYESFVLAPGSDYPDKVTECIIKGMDTVIRNARAALRIK